MQGVEQRIGSSASFPPPCAFSSSVQHVIQPTTGLRRRRVFSSFAFDVIRPSPLEEFAIAPFCEEIPSFLPSPFKLLSSSVVFLFETSWFT